MADDRCGHQPVITAAGYSSQAVRWKAGDNAHSGATPLTSQPQTNPKYQFVNALYSSLALFETTNRVLQLVEDTLIASLITQRSLVQIQPPQPNKSTIYRIPASQTDSHKLPIRKISGLGARFHRLEHHFHDFPIRFPLRCRHRLSINIHRRLD